ncbi:MAG: Frizzy aggregation protein FrzB [Myxococcaceae bacterium]
MTAAPREISDVDLVVFEVAGCRYAADLGQVRRVDLNDPTESVGPLLGQPLTGARALVFSAGEGVERRLVVDRVVGVTRVPVTSLRRMPSAVHGAKYSIGAWLEGDTTVLLVDLISMV